VKTHPRTRPARRWAALKPAALLSAALVLLPACTVLPKGETLVFYQLPEPQAAVPRQPSPLPLSLRVATPRGNQLIDSERILVAPRGDEISAYKGARWSDSATVLLRDRLVDAFRDSGGFRAVAAGGGQLHADLELGGDLTAFQAQYVDGAPVVRLRLDAMLARAGSGTLLAARRFEASVPSQGKEVAQVVQAFGQAADTLAGQLVPWATQRAAQAR